MTPTRIISLCLFLFFAGNAFAEELPDSLLNYDDSKVSWYEYDQDRLEKIRADPDFSYEEAPVDLNLWDKFLNWLGSLIENLLDGLGVSPDLSWLNVIKIILYIFAAAGLIYLIIKLIESRFGIPVFRKREDQSYDVIEENIHEINFQTEIERAVELGEFRKAIRLVYLQALKQLSDKQLIVWESGKTNHEYLYELKNKPLESIFSDLGYYFEFTWYGNFKADRSIFEQAQQLLLEFQKKLDRS